MIFSLQEIIDLAAMTLFLGWLFSDSLRRPVERRDITDFAREDFQKIKLRDIEYASLVVAPGIVLHEVAHKLVAMAFGASAHFFAFYRNGTTMLLGVAAIIMKLANTGFMLIVPGFVMHSGTGPMQSAIIALAGPLVHLIFWIGASLLIRSRDTSRRFKYTLALISRINMFLFIFNMLPIPGFDGYQAYSGLLASLTAK